MSKKLTIWRDVLTTIAPIPVIAIAALIVLATVLWLQAEPALLRASSAGGGLIQYMPPVF